MTASDVLLRKRRHITLILGIVAALCPSLAVTQTLMNDTRTDLASALRVIRPLVRDDPERAILMLKRLTDEYPTNARVLLLLGESYQVVGQVDSAIATYELCIEYNPVHLQAAASLGMLYIQTGDTDRGEKVFRDLLRRTSYGVNTYRTIASTLSSQGYYDEALVLYREGRERNRDNYILTIDIAYLEKTMGNYEGALEEYLRLVEVSPRHQGLARTKMLELTKDPDADTERLIQLLEERAQTPTPPSPVVLEVLAITYLDNGMLERALEVALDSEARGNSDGSILFGLATRTIAEYDRRTGAEKVEYFNLALRSLEAFLDRHGNSPQRPRAELMLTDLLVDLASGRVDGPPNMPLATATDRAIEALDWVIRTYPGSEYAEQAYLKKGDVIFRVRKDPEGALAVYQRGMRTASFYPTHFAERLGRVYLVMEDYDNARKHFTRMIVSADQDMHEAGIFYTGLLLSFTGQYEAARDTLTGLAESNPSAQYTNDALHLAWELEEGLQGDQAVLATYLDALHAEIAADTTTAIAELGAIAKKPPETPLRSRAVVKLGDMYMGLGEYALAIDAYEGWLRDYPDDIEQPNVHRKIGQVYEWGYGRLDVALDKYEEILLLYPHYIFLDEVRDDVTRLRRKLGKP